MLSVVARTRAIGFHQWPDAPPMRSYLRDRHRHEFRIEVQVEVAGMDRAVEFHDLRGDIEDLLPRLGDPSGDGTFEFGSQSCEQLAGRLAVALTGRQYTVLRVVFSEDGENDGVWTS